MLRSTDDIHSFKLLLSVPWSSTSTAHFPDVLSAGDTCGEPATLFPFWNVTLPSSPKPKPKPLVKPQVEHAYIYNQSL